MEIEKCGIPWRKLVVPSSGSTIHLGLAGSPSISPPSASSIPQSGRALRSSSTIVCSARLSAMETKSAGPLRLTCSCSTSPKSRRRRGAALRAARCITVIRPEWATTSPLPQARERALVRPPHILAIIHVNDDLRPRCDVRRNEYLHAVVQHRRLVGRARGLTLHDGIGLDDGRLDLVGQLNADRPLVVELHHHVHALLEEVGGVAEKILGQHHL